MSSWTFWGVKRRHTSLRTEDSFWAYLGPNRQSKKFFYGSKGVSCKISAKSAQRCRIESLVGLVSRNQTAPLFENCRSFSFIQREIFEKTRQEISQKINFSFLGFFTRHVKVKHYIWQLHKTYLDAVYVIILPIF